VRVLPSRPRRSLLPVPIAVLALAAPTAGADVLVTPVASGLEQPSRSPGSLLIAPTGERRALASPRIGDEDGYQVPVVSPDRRWVARTFDRRTLLVPTDGGPITTLSTPGLGPGFRGTVWWDADAAHVMQAESDEADARAVVQRCSVADRRCVTFPTRGRLFLQPLTTGASLWDRPDPLEALDDVPSDAFDGWTRASSGTIRRARRATRRLVTGGVTLVAADGSTSRVLLRTRGRATTGVDRYVAAPAAGPGVLVGRTRTRSIVEHRTRRGRLEMRLVDREGEPRWALVTADGRVGPFRFRPTDGDRVADLQPIVAAPEGWYVGLRSRGGASLVGRASADGTVRRLTLGATPLTPDALHAALGLPKDDAPGDSVVSELRVVGHEAATASAIVAYDDAAARPVVARIPQDGGPPALAYRGKQGEDVQLSSW
jgi:hypothetical protein